MARWKKEAVEWIKAFLVGIIIFVLIRSFFFANYVVEGESMMPTLKDGNKLVVNKIGYQIGDLHRFDVIVFHANKREDYVKRIIGLPGDEIEYRADRLYINGKEFDEPFLEPYRKEILGEALTGDFTLKELTGKLKVPEGKLFVMGDNRLESWDSRHFGFIPAKNVVGKVNLLYWPITDLAVSL
ncbi:signal peptidase I [Neobacillus piezotolerans]|uniref:Signal peptidase I n=1 Tax=Neobacillus piezotolerans TaxID=2259171 RepID=A0A3D8GM94_9BACI|nr:signal peptidase I [Neobacillus piezotolerans]RDU35518.1 signal peptidase I [Neobacillus piezotolerans]